VLSGKVSKFSITFTLDISPDYALYLVSGVLRDHQQSKSESVFKVLPLVRCVRTIITSSLFIGFEHTSNKWKVDCTWTRLKSLKFSDHSNLISPESQQPSQLQKVITPKLLIISGCANNRWKDEKILYIFSVELRVRFRLKGIRT
jgi:hypothetical protein